MAGSVGAGSVEAGLVESEVENEVGSVGSVAVEATAGATEAVRD